MRSFRGRSVALGITGSIAAYKALGLVRAVRAAGIDVWPLLTPAAQRFVTPLSVATLAGRPAILDLWAGAERGEIGHVELAHRAEAVVVAPASAASLGRLARGEASGAIDALVLASHAPLVLAPAMETHMWEHPATRAHVEALAGRGACVVAPGAGVLASGGHGVGRLAATDAILEAVFRALTPADLAGRRLLITAGATREAFDPARFVSNGSTGKMGFALARAAMRRGAAVTLIAGHVGETPPPGADVTRVVTTRELLSACRAALPRCEVLMMAAAPADFRPVSPRTEKLKKHSVRGPLKVELEATEDVLQALPRAEGGRLTVGFAAETRDFLAHGRRKLADKQLDMLVVNPVGSPDAGFASDSNRGWLMARAGDTVALPQASKLAMAETILDHVASALGAARA